MDRKALAARLFDDDPKHVDRFGLLLGLVVASVAVLSLVDLDSPFENVRAELGWVVVSMTVGITLIVALRASGVARRVRLVAEWLVIAAIFVSAAFTLADVVTSQNIYVANVQPGWLWVILAAVAPLVVVRRLLNHERVTGQTLAGAVAAFLLIALLANYAYLTLNSIQTGPFFGQPEPTTKFMYYSLVTLTTTGYGDLTAATDLGRFMSTAEAIVGQVYLVTVVATFVSLNTSRVREIRRGRATD